MELHEMTYVDVDGNYLTACSSQGDFWFIENGDMSERIPFSSWCRYMIKWLDKHQALVMIP